MVRPRSTFYIEKGLRAVYRPLMNSFSCSSWLNSAGWVKMRFQLIENQEDHHEYREDCECALKCSVVWECEGKVLNTGDENLFRCSDKTFIDWSLYWKVCESFNIWYQNWSNLIEQFRQVELQHLIICRVWSNLTLTAKVRTMLRWERAIVTICSLA